MECHPCYRWLLKIVAPYLAQWPDVDVDVKQKFQFGGVGALFGHVDGLDHERLLAEELGTDTMVRFRSQLASLDLDPGAYLFMPVHPWQWHNRLAMVFAADIALRRIVFLGESSDEYVAQQSIRTLFNLSRPDRRYVKTALSILNMGFMRGLSPAYMQGTPAINQWLAALVRGDAELAARGFDILCEEAAIGYRQPGIDAALDKHSPYRKMLAALWRESAVKCLRPGERLMTMWVTRLNSVSVRQSTIVFWWWLTEISWLSILI